MPEQVVLANLPSPLCPPGESLLPVGQFTCSRVDQKDLIFGKKPQKTRKVPPLKTKRGTQGAFEWKKSYLSRNPKKRRISYFPRGYFTVSIEFGVQHDSGLRGF